MELRWFLFEIMVIISVVFADITLEQNALDVIAEQIRKNGKYPNCTSPNLSNCAVGTECKGTNCYDFNIKTNSEKSVTYLFDGNVPFEE